LYIRTKTIKGHRYYYLVRGFREGERVRQVVIRYLGKNPWGLLRPRRFLPPERKEYTGRILNRLRERFDDGEIGVEGGGTFGIAYDTGSRWFDKYPSLQQKFGASLQNTRDSALHSDLKKLDAFMPDDIKGDGSPKDRFSRLAAVCLSDPMKAHREVRQAAHWMMNTLYEEADIREELTRLKLWLLVDSRSGNTRRGTILAKPQQVYAGPVDRTTKTILGYSVVEAGDQGYVLRGKLGGRFRLERKRFEPDQLIVKSCRTQKLCTLKGIRRFTDQGGTLRAVV
jgi:hypothetical protein